MGKHPNPIPLPRKKCFEEQIIYALRSVEEKRCWGETRQMLWTMGQSCMGGNHRPSQREYYPASAVTATFRKVAAYAHVNGAGRGGRLPR